MFPFGFTATVNRGGGRDRFGNPIAGTTHDVEDCAAAPAGSTELVNGEAVVIAQEALYAPYDADLNSQDTVTIPAAQPITAGRYQVDGQPQRWRNPFTGREGGTVARLTRADAQ